MKRTFSAGLIIVVFSVLSVIPSVDAQRAVTPEQMRLFESLSEAERTKIIGQLGEDQPQFQQDVKPVPGDEESSGLVPSIAPKARATGRIQGGESLVIDATLKPEFDAEEFMADSYRARLLGSHFVQLDKKGVLEVPGIASIPLGGLTAREISIRLESEPLLQPLKISVTILPLTPFGMAALQPFGQTLFGRDVQPMQNMPVPRDYVIGPGDTINVQLYGNENYEVQLAVNNDGTINFPKLGPQSVVGLTFGELKDLIENRIDEQLIGTEAAITMGALRSIRVFVVGDVQQPGAYTMSSLARITNAIFFAGGISDIGSFREIQLKRDGKLVRTLDLYDLLLRGDTRHDAQLKPNDVIFVPTVKRRVGIDGEVYRPAIYEFNGERTLEDLIKLAGGLRPTADTSRLEMQRVNQRGVRSIETMDLMKPEDVQFELQAGDLLTVYPVLQEVQDGVFLSGHVNRPGGYEWWPGMTIADLLPNESYLRPRADLAYVLIRREEGPERSARVFSTDIAAVWSDPSAISNVELKARDLVMVFESGIGRSAAIQAVLGELRVQSTSDQPVRVVRVGGQVRAPGSYPLETDMRISDLLRAGGGLGPAAYDSEAELTRYFINETGERQTRIVEVDLAAILEGDESADIGLEPYDYLSVKVIPDWGDLFEVSLRGEVRFPGTYPVRRGETLVSVIDRAGGLTDLASTAGSVFTRETLREREEQQLRQLISRLEGDIAAMSAQAAADPTADVRQSMAAGQALLTRARSTEPTGRLVIDLNNVIASGQGGANDVDLRPGDTLLVPRRAQDVTVLGEVQYATSHLYDRGRPRDAYIDLSGGLTVNADKRRIYIVRANGAVIAGKGSRWFRGGTAQIYPGDTIVVPVDTDRVPSLVQWTSITQILYQMAIAVAAVNSF